MSNATHQPFLLTALMVFSLISSSGVQGAETLVADDFSNQKITEFHRIRVSDMDAGWVRCPGSSWRILNGVLANGSKVKSKVGEGAVGQIIDLSKMKGGMNLLNLSFDYVVGDKDEILYVYLWAYVKKKPGKPLPAAQIFTLNTESTHGHAFEQGDRRFHHGYNLGSADGTFSDGGFSSGVKTGGSTIDAVASLKYAPSLQYYDKLIDLSTLTKAPQHLAAYDYLVIGFARKIGGSESRVRIDNLKLAAGIKLERSTVIGIGGFSCVLRPANLLK